MIATKRFARSAFVALWVLALVSLWTGCDDSPGGQTPDDVVDEADEVTLGFDGHTVPELKSVEEFVLLADEEFGRQIGKFIITSFVSEGRVVYLDNRFYALHDEWYWFYLMNGTQPPGSRTIPVYGMQFDSIQAIVDWATLQTDLPLDLTFVQDHRLYSPEFYTMSLTDPRVYGLGSILHLPAITTPIVREEIWAFELEYVDNVDHSRLSIFFENLDRTLPPEVSGKIKWLVRSPNQETLAESMIANQLQYHDRIMYYSELAIPGEVEVYSEGLTAGRVHTIWAADGGLDNTTPYEILMLDAIPDYLPPAGGLLTSLPQTPLAHINVLARNRGIPNAYRGALLDDPSITQLGRVRAPVIVHAVRPDHLDIVPILESEFATWNSLGSKPSIAVEPVDPNTIPYVYGLEELSLTDISALRLVIGGKAAGFLALQESGEVILPDRPSILTVRAYMEHLAPIKSNIEAMLANQSFVSSARTRLLVLEGGSHYDVRYPSAEDLAFKQSFYADHPYGDPIGDILAAGGLMNMIRTRPIEPATIASISSTLSERYASYSALQGLRFRSSSSIEDIEGFNGAGVYDSNTGFLHPELQPDPADQSHSLEWAIKKTWASYWGAEAFEERRLEKVDHLSGNMAALIHARFDDALERSNGVFTFTIMPTGQEPANVMDLNAQDGFESVTNPTPGLNALPEVDRVIDQGGTLQIERLASSNQLPAGEQILSDAELLEIYRQAQLVTLAYLNEENRHRAAEQAAQTLTLDFEYREMDTNWPALESGTPFPRRIVIKQARSLEPGARSIPDSVRTLPFPRDVLVRARRVDRKQCTGDRFRFVTTELYTEPLLSPDMGYSVEPLNAFFSLELSAAMPELGKAAGDRVVLTHLYFDSAHPELAQGGPWSLNLTLDAASATTYALESISLHGDQSYTFSNSTGQATGTYSCETTTLYSTPQDYLMLLLEEKGIH